MSHLKRALEILSRSLGSLLVEGPLVPQHYTLINATERRNLIFPWHTIEFFTETNLINFVILKQSLTKPSFKSSYFFYIQPFMACLPHDLLACVILRLCWGSLAAEEASLKSWLNYLIAAVDHRIIRYFVSMIQTAGKRATCFKCSLLNTNFVKDRLINITIWKNQCTKWNVCELKNDLVKA